MLCAGVPNPGVLVGRMESSCWWLLETTEAGKSSGGGREGLKGAQGGTWQQWGWVDQAQEKTGTAMVACSISIPRLIHLQINMNFH